MCSSVCFALFCNAGAPCTTAAHPAHSAPFTLHAPPTQCGPLGPTMPRYGPPPSELVQPHPSLMALPHSSHDKAVERAYTRYGYMPPKVRSAIDHGRSCPCSCFPRCLGCSFPWQGGHFG